MNEILKKVCRTNLLSTLEKLKHHADPVVVGRAVMVEGLFLDFESFDKPVPTPGVSDVIPDPISDSVDNTNYERYRALRKFGLSPVQLVEISTLDGLHELRKIRMLRLVFGLSLDEATTIIKTISEIEKD